MLLFCSVLAFFLAALRRFDFEDVMKWYDASVLMLLHTFQYASICFVAYGTVVLLHYDRWRPRFCIYFSHILSWTESDGPEIPCFYDITQKSMRLKVDQWMPCPLAIQSIRQRKQGRPSRGRLLQILFWCRTPRWDALPAWQRHSRITYLTSEGARQFQQRSANSFHAPFTRPGR